MTDTEAPAQHLSLIPWMPLPNICLRCGARGRHALVGRELSYAPSGLSWLPFAAKRIRRLVALPLCPDCVSKLANEERLSGGLLLVSALSLAAFAAMWVLGLSAYANETPALVTVAEALGAAASGFALVASMMFRTQGLRLAEPPVRYWSVLDRPLEVLKLTGVHDAALEDPS